MRRLDVLFLEPYDGGSHRAFRRGLAARSRHRIRSLTLPPRFWKWRMRGAAVHFADRIAAERPACDLILATDFLNLADLKGLLPSPWSRRPLLYYLHENQLTYPLSPREEFDFHFGFTNIVSALAADRVLFNSAFHRRLFLDSLPDYLARMPEAVPRGVRRRLAERSGVLPVGIERRPHPEGAYPRWLGGPCEPDAGGPWPRWADAPLVLWNHRWEFDKRPDLLARALRRLLRDGIDFRVVLLGEPRRNEEAFAGLRAELGDRCLAFGRAPGRRAYDRWLERADVVVSCAEQEYFGIAVAEAVQAGCYPVLPRRQVYPSLYGARCRGPHLYEGDGGLAALLGEVLAGRRGHVCSLPLDCDEFCWERVVPLWDAELDRLAGRG